MSHDPMCEKHFHPFTPGAMFAAQPFTERQRLYRALKDLLADWATSEIERID